MEKSKHQLAFPVSDTIPGPGNFQAKVSLEDSENDCIPTVETRLPVGHLGHGTAEDIPSTDMTPKPSSDDPE